MRAVVTAYPGDELLCFPAVLRSHPSRDTLLISVSDAASTIAPLHNEQCQTVASRFDYHFEPIGLATDREGRLAPAVLSERLKSLLELYAVRETFTYAIQGDRGKRARADIAMAVWLATQGCDAYFQAKHTRRVTSVVHASPTHVLEAYDALASEYGLVEDIERSVGREESYTSHSASEAEVAYQELSRGFDGVRALVARGDLDPWGYYSSAYARERADAVSRLVARALDGRTRGVVWEVGPASGHVTRSLLSLPEVKRLVAIERFPEFQDVFRYHIGTSDRVDEVLADVRDISPWDCDAAVLIDCLSFHLSRDEQISVVRRAAKDGTAIVLGGESVWAEDLAGTVCREFHLVIDDRARCRGAFEPVREGHDVHSVRPPWAAFLLRPRS